MLSFLSRVGLHIWSVTWPLASRGTHPVVFFYSHIKANVSTTYKYHSGGCGHFILSTHRTRLSQVSRLFLPLSRSSSLVRLVGSNSSSWGWCLKTMKVYHDSRKYRHGVPYPRLPIVFDHLMKYLWSLNPVLAFTVTLRQCETCIRDVDEKLRVPETFYMLLDMDRGTLAFQVNILEC